MRLGRFGLWVGMSVTSIFVICLVWISCSQKAPINPTQSLMDEVPMFSEMVAKPEKIKVGGSEASIQARLVDEKGVALVDRTVTFATTLGSLNVKEKKTDGDGWVMAILKSGNTAGTANVTVSYDQYTKKSVGVQIAAATDTSETQMEILITKQELLANGIDQTQIFATLIPGSGQVVRGSMVLFTATAGAIPSAVTVADENQAIAPLTSPASVNDITAAVTATYRDISKTVQVLFKGVQFSAEVNQLTILADGTSASTITAHVKETKTHIGIVSADVRFGATIGDIANLVMTDERGVAVAKLTGNKPGKSMVVVSYGRTFLDTLYVTLLESAPVYLDVSVSTQYLPADGFSQAVIKARVADFNHNPIPDGTPVSFKLLEGSGSIDQQKTTVGGIAESSFTAGITPSTVKIAVSVATLADTITIYCRVGDADNVVISTVPANLIKLPADGISTVTIKAAVVDSRGNPVQGVTVNFSATIGDITKTAPTNAQGIATAQFSSGTIGNATISASVQKTSGMQITGTIQIQLTPGKPNSFSPIEFSPTELAVKESGGTSQTTANVSVFVRDSKNNAVEEGTLVRFTIVAGSGIGASLSSDQPVPTKNGKAQISLTSGYKSGVVRVQAEVVDDRGNPLNPSVKIVSSRLIIHAGPPYIENVNYVNTSHMTVAASRHNICVNVVDTAKIVVYMGDKFNNPIEQASYHVIPSGGYCTTSSLTNTNGIGVDTLYAAQVYPDIWRYNHYENPEQENMLDPNLHTVIPGLIPDFEGSQVRNSQGGYGENDGVARVMVVTKGRDASGKEVSVWNWTRVVFSSKIIHFADDSKTVIANEGDILHYQQPGKKIHIRIWDINGNPICSGSKLKAEIKGGTSQAELSWTEMTTSLDEGTTSYGITISNKIDLKNPQPGWVYIHITIDSKNPVEQGLDKYLDTEQFYVEGPP